MSISDARIREMAEVVIEDCQSLGADTRRIIADAIRRAVEEATKPPEGGAREAEIRDRTARQFPDTLVYAEQDRRDLLALLDRERGQRACDVAVLTDALVEDGRFDAGVRAGLAQALAALQTMIDEEDGYLRESPLRGRERVQAFVAARAYVEGSCAPALPPPHLVAVARLRRLEAALVEIVRIIEAFPGDTAENELEAIEEAAKTALDDEP